jgi:hypothetical protein
MDRTVRSIVPAQPARTENNPSIETMLVSPFSRCTSFHFPTWQKKPRVILLIEVLCPKREGTTASLQVRREPREDALLITSSAEMLDGSPFGIDILAPSENLGLLATAQAASLDEKHKPLVMNSLLHIASSRQQTVFQGFPQRSTIR